MPGTGFPMFTPERWAHGSRHDAVRDEVKPGSYKDNAIRLLGLA